MSLWRLTTTVHQFDPRFNRPMGNVIVTTTREIVAGAFDGEQLGRRGNEAKRRVHFIERTERVTRSMNE